MSYFWNFLMIVCAKWIKMPYISVIINAMLSFITISVDKGIDHCGHACRKAQTIAHTLSTMKTNIIEIGAIPNRYFPT